MERVKGIEPSYEAWEAAVLPLNYTRLRQTATFGGSAFWPLSSLLSAKGQALHSSGIVAMRVPLWIGGLRGTGQVRAQPPGKIFCRAAQWSPSQLPSNKGNAPCN
jgi:hypothetical protein